MTSDAKTGLLLGLVFIFIIAFIINGLPGFQGERHNNELTGSMVDSRSKPLGIGTAEREVIKQEALVRQRSLAEIESRPAVDNDIRFAAALPENQSAAKAVEAKAAPAAESLFAVEKKAVRVVESSKSALPKVYVVAEGDSLAVIAEKFYGAEEGNRRINVSRIFESNSKILKSPDAIYAGQRIIIPALSASGQAEVEVGGVLAGGVLEKVESVGKRHLEESHLARRSGWYVVREGDSLWRIAAEQLGAGNRYSEIAKLNADILYDENALCLGMRLRMPTQ
jgi:nucleoid-associated protein YgaU